jgi:tRNA pseudouridine55 synthase
MVTVYRLQITEYQYPRFVLEVQCSSGTYVRSLGRDLACAVGTAAVMASLVRTAIGPFDLAEAHDPDQLTAESLPKKLLSPLAALGSMPRVKLSPEEASRVRNGVAIPSTAPGPAGQELAGVDPADGLVGILARQQDGRLRPTRTFPPCGWRR